MEGGSKHRADVIAREREVMLTRRSLLEAASATVALGGSTLGLPRLFSARAEGAPAQTTVQLPFPGEPNKRPITTAFPQKGAMVLQRTRPPLLETPFEVFDKGVFTPNDQFYVRWHWAVIPQSVDVDKFRLNVHGQVAQPQVLTLKDIMALPPMDLAAVNQCSGNSRGFFQPRVAGGEWGNGAMGNARWTGVSSRASSIEQASNRVPCGSASTAWTSRSLRTVQTS